MLQTDLGQIDTVMLALDRKRPEVAAHCRRVSDYSVRLATQLGLGPQDLETIRLGGLLHDVGKMLVPSRILNKPGRPTDKEWQELKIHPELGVEIAHRSGFDDEVSAIVLYHHERWDGRGYPDGLTAERIPMGARIIGVVEIYDALTTSRPYQEKMTPELAVERLRDLIGTVVDPEVHKALLQVVARREALVFLDESRG